MKKISQKIIIALIVFLAFVSVLSLFNVSDDTFSSTKITANAPSLLLPSLKSAILIPSSPSILPTVPITPGTSEFDNNFSHKVYTFGKISSQYKLSVNEPSKFPLR